VDLRTSLCSIKSMADLPRLIRALGHQEAWEVLPEEAWNGRSGRAFTLTAVGKAGRLPWLATESHAPERDAVLLAHRITRRGRSALILALDPRARRLGVAVAFDRCPAIELDLTDPDPEVLASLARLSGPREDAPLAFAARATDALASEPVGRRFFRQFKLILDRMTVALPVRMKRHERHGIVLLQLTRVLFLYFVQSKGWLAGRDQFLAQEVDRCLSRGRRIHRDLLRPLFFGTLNRPSTARSRTALKFGAIPFLNGGLFEPHPLEKRYPVDLPNPLWRDAFDGLFERFHFTIADTGRYGSVAPDMLGRVFEGVMAPEDRRASGTFYTPAALVDRLLDTALTVILADKLQCSEAEAERRLHEPSRETAGILRSITVLDPTVGSGAFLLSALQRLAASGGSAGSPVARKRSVLQHNLFGVDQNAAAVRLAELRLWLSVIADDPSTQPEQVHPLPNLDCLIRQGDTLFDPPGLELAAGADPPEESVVAELSRLRSEVIVASGYTKRSLVRELQALETRVLEDSLTGAERRHRQAVAECLQQGRALDLFGVRRGLDTRLRAQLSSSRHSLRRVRQARRRLLDEGEIPWFHYQSAFADVFARGGFDLIIGNPPWLRSEAIPSLVRKQLSGRYRWWRGGGTYGNAPDLAVAFLERAFELAGPNGAVAMLVPAKIATAGYAAAARHALASRTTLHYLADLTGTPMADFDATVYPLALIATRSKPSRKHWVRTSLSRGKGNRLPQSELQSGGPWIFAGPRVHRVLAELAKRHAPFADSFACHLGVKTGLNEFFLNPPLDVESELLRWAIRGRDVTAFGCQTTVRLFWTHDSNGEVLRNLPAQARRYVAQHETALRARKDYRTGPPWTLFRTRPSLAQYRVIWSDLARQLNAVALTGPYDLTCIPLNTCYVAAVPSALQADALAAWMNSTWIRVLARLAAVPASGGFARFNARVVGQLPLPPSIMSDPGLAELGRKEQPDPLVSPALDKLVARHLELSTSAQRTLSALVSKRSVHHR
jgi:hypothetical protein